MTNSTKIAYLVSRFPSVTETFILREMDELEKHGFDIELFSLVREDLDMVHASAKARLPGLLAGNDLSLLTLLACQLRWARRRPYRLGSTWLRALWGNRRSRKFLSRALAVVPVASVFAERIESAGIERVHAHWATHPALGAFVIKALTDVPYGVTAHAHDIYVEQSMMAEKLEAADLVVTISEFNRNYLHERVPGLASKCAVVRCGVPEAGIRPMLDAPAPDEQAAITAGTVELACVAQLSPYKGQRYLIEACRLLVERGIAFRCRFAGDGPDRAVLERLVAELGLADQVQFLGSLDGPGVAELLAEADVFVLPSTVEASGKMEGVPVALMEAMAAGVPVVASQLSGIPELVEHNVTGLLAEPADVSGLADAVQRLVGDPMLASELARGASKRVSDEFTIEGNGELLADLLRRAQKEHRPLNTQEREEP